MLTWLAIASCLALTPTPVESNDGGHRYALIIGANHGNAGDVVLHYAEADAGEMADVLQQMGRFRQRDIVMLNSPTARDVREAFTTLRRRIERERTAEGSVLLVYYSGHADAAAMHLAGSLLPWSEAVALTNASSADLRLLVVDACRSGELTQGKGALLERPFSLPREGRELPRGIAIVTSASAGESAQESNSLRASFFTHHFVAGLRGAADLNSDGRVTLSEAFSYSSEQAAGDTAETMIGIQHATYHFHLTGRLELSLTEPGVGKRMAPLRIDAPGTYVFRNGAASHGTVVLQTQVGTGAQRTLWLPPGLYSVQRRTPDTITQGTVDLRGSNGARLDVAQLQSQEYAAVSAKGGPEPEAPAAAPRWNLAAVFMGGAPALGQFSPALGTGLLASIPVALGDTRWAVDLQALALHSSAHNATLDVSEWDTSFAGGLRGIFVHLEHLELSAGAHVGALIAAQATSGTGALGSRNQLSPMAEGVLRLDIPLAAGWFVTGQGVARGAWIDRQSDSGSTARIFTLQPLGMLGIGASW